MIKEKCDHEYMQAAVKHETKTKKFLWFESKEDTTKYIIGFHYICRKCCNYKYIKLEK